MTSSPPEMQRKVTQLGNDVNDIYEMLSTISMTQTHHGRRLNDVEAKIDGVETRLTARLDGLGTRLDGLDTRLDGLDTRLDGLDTRLDGIQGRLGTVDDNVAEILRRVSG
jgi:hypothetical protein